MILSRTSFTIGGLAREAGVHVETIRYYERRGLLPRPEKPFQGYRQYSLDSLERLIFIRNAQRLGFTLLEIEEILSLRIGGDRCKAVLKKAEVKKAGIEEKIQTLERWRDALESLIQRCRSGQKDEDDCPILRTLSVSKKDSHGRLG